MRSRHGALAALALALALTGSGCYGQSKTLPQKTARITVDGATRSSHAVTCGQVQSLLTVEISAAPARVRMLLRLDDPVIPDNVDIHDFNGFTGVANAGAGKAQATFSDSTYAVTGTAQGPNLEHPDTMKTADFRIEVQC